MTFQKTFALFAAVAHAGSRTSSKKKNKIVEEIINDGTLVAKLDKLVEEKIETSKQTSQLRFDAQQNQISSMKDDINGLSKEFQEFKEATKIVAEWTKQYAKSNMFNSESETDGVETADTTDENSESDDYESNMLVKEIYEQTISDYIGEDSSEDSGEPEIYEPKFVGWEENQRLESARRHANKERLKFGEPARVYPDTNMLQRYDDTVEDSAHFNIINPVLSETDIKTESKEVVDNDDSTKDETEDAALSEVEDNKDIEIIGTKTNRLLESTDKIEDNLIEATINESVKTTKEVEENKYVDSEDEFVKQLLVDQQKRKEEWEKLEKAQAEEATKVLKEWNDKQDRLEKSMKAGAELSEDQAVYHGDSQLFTKTKQ